ncbi:MAG TPA: helix-turn-helix domain-containing protein [Terriglobia bacterium]|nr:helix-turn-helix domain-containing protein [Terriglobia bacterium]
MRTFQEPRVGSRGHHSKASEDRRPILNSSEVARLFGITRATLYRWLKQEKIPEPMVDPDNGQRMWRQSDIDTVGQFLKKRGREK